MTTEQLPVHFPQEPDFDSVSFSPQGAGTWLLPCSRSVMNKSLVTLGLAFTAALTASQAQNATNIMGRAASDNLENRFGAGLMFGEPIGLTLKYWVNETFAVDGGLGASFHREDGLQLHSDALWHVFGSHHCPHGLLSPYIGVGGRAKFQDGDDRFGVRVPIGVSYMLDRSPVDMFLEIAPVLDVEPSVQGSFNVAAGARFWF